MININIISIDIIIDKFIHFPFPLSLKMFKISKNSDISNVLGLKPPLLVFTKDSFPMKLFNTVSVPNEPKAPSNNINHR